jgi:hypothetical protein
MKSSPDPIFTAHVDMDANNVIRSILVQDTTNPNRGWFTLQIDIKAEQIQVYNSDLED